MNVEGAFNDPYCYARTSVLKNKAGIRDPAALGAFEREMTLLRAEEPLPWGRFGPTHYRAIHRHLFQDVYGWAGRYRTVPTARQGKVFCYPERVARSVAFLFDGLPAPPFTGDAPFDAFAAAVADVLGELNAIHPFRAGNGRAQLAFLYLVALRAGHPLDLKKVRRETMMPAMIASFHGDQRLLTAVVTALRL